ncbi:MAG: hypothetical protein ACFE0O_13775 [Opitutales bacterium]
MPEDDTPKKPEPEDAQSEQSEDKPAAPKLKVTRSPFAPKLGKASNTISIHKKAGAGGETPPAEKPSPDEGNPEGSSAESDPDPKETPASSGKPSKPLPSAAISALSEESDAARHPAASPTDSDDPAGGEPPAKPRIPRPSGTLKPSEAGSDEKPKPATAAQKGGKTADQAKPAGSRPSPIRAPQKPKPAAAGDVTFDDEPEPVSTGPGAAMLTLDAIAATGAVVFALLIVKNLMPYLG